MGFGVGFARTPFQAFFFIFMENFQKQGAQWLSGSVLYLRPRGSGFEPHRRHFVLSLSKTHLSLLSTGSTQEDPSRHNLIIVDTDVKNQIKQFSEKSGRINR